MSHTIPTTREEYDRQFALNTKIEGFGFDVTSILPCPFCAAPDFMPIKIIQATADMRKQVTCAVCGRSGMNLVTETVSGVKTEFVQTAGDDPPEWLRPWPRRVEMKAAVSAAFGQLEANEQASAELDEVEDPHA